MATKSSITYRRRQAIQNMTDALARMSAPLDVSATDIAKISHRRDLDFQDMLRHEELAYWCESLAEAVIAALTEKELVQAQAQQVGPLKTKIKALEAKNKALTETQEPNLVLSLKAEIERLKADAQAKPKLRRKAAPKTSGKG